MVQVSRRRLIAGLAASAVPVVFGADLRRSHDKEVIQLEKSIGGRIGVWVLDSASRDIWTYRSINVYPGSAVQANTTTLVTITQLDPIAVSFSLPQRHLADALAALPGGGAAVSATLPDNGGELKGRMKFVDNLVDAGSGTVKAKAVFNNTGGRLWPGAFVNVAMTARVIKDAVIVPQATIIQGARGSIVYVVQDGRALARPVQLVHAEGDEAAVTGVRPGDKVVLDGRQNLRPGAAVAERSREAAPAASGTASVPVKKASAP